ncbi:Protein of unknown function [Methylomagnum ishizawai]|uniref:Uncharacterized protein n=1 Tax=Methylomagnum ishizawai TaxID=1760988 RepID=A0A1Y6D8E6_9GAMM|nr:zinc-finger-containing protein [Methylomagnum ishizawai]SMF96075.1 Protein of unknown function [Methylomagnum ishizawai]
MSAPAKKTPWNPSRKAMARVSNPLPAPEQCPYCGGPVQIVNNGEIYGRVYGEWPWAYLCRPCDAYVGMHPFTHIPLGTLADRETREARKSAKAPFEALHRSRLMDRDTAYRLLAERLGIPQAECHFGWFDPDLCARAKQAAESILREYLP